MPLVAWLVYHTALACTEGGLREKVFIEVKSYDVSTRPAQGLLQAGAVVLR